MTFNLIVSAAILATSHEETKSDKRRGGGLFGRNSNKERKMQRLITPVPNGALEGSASKGSDSLSLDTAVHCLVPAASGRSVFAVLEGGDVCESRLPPSESGAPKARHAFAPDEVDVEALADKVAGKFAIGLYVYLSRLTLALLALLLFFRSLCFALLLFSFLFTLLLRLLALLLFLMLFSLSLLFRCFVAVLTLACVRLSLLAAEDEDNVAYRTRIDVEALLRRDVAAWLARADSTALLALAREQPDAFARLAQCGEHGQTHLCCALSAMLGNRFKQK